MNRELWELDYKTEKNNLFSLPLHENCLILIIKDDVRISLKLQNERYNFLYNVQINLLDFMSFLVQSDNW